MAIPLFFLTRKVRRAGIPPTPRCGFSTAVHKRRNLVVFGGVYDQYDKHDLVSTFYNDVYVFRMVPSASSRKGAGTPVLRLPTKSDLAGTVS